MFITHEQHCKCEFTKNKLTSNLIRYPKRVTPYLKSTEKQVGWNPIVSSRKGSQTLKITAYFLSLMVVGSLSRCPPAAQKTLLTFPSSWKLFSIDIFLEKKTFIDGCWQVGSKVCNHEVHVILRRAKFMLILIREVELFKQHIGQSHNICANC